MAEVEKICLYVIKWMRSSKGSDYQTGVIVQTDDKQFIPTPPTIFSSLATLFQFLTSNFGDKRVSILAMGCDVSDKTALENFVKHHHFVFEIKYLVRPRGKRIDGTQLRVFIVDNHIDDMRALKEIMMDEHFEIISVARNPSKAIKFFTANHDRIDLVFTEIYLDCEDMFDVIRQMKALKPEVRIIGMSWTTSRDLIDKLMPLKIDRFMIKPFVKERILETIERATAEF